MINSSDDVAAVSSSSAFFDNLIPQNMSTLEIPVTEGRLHEMCFCPLRKKGEEEKNPENYQEESGPLQQMGTFKTHDLFQCHATSLGIVQEILFADKRPIKSIEESSR